MRFLLRTFGCRANQYDSEAARSLLVASGAQEVTTAEEADVAVFNSCSVTAAAEAELRKAVRRVARLNPELRTVVMGCAPGLPARDERTTPLRTLPNVTATVHGADLSSLAVALELDRRLVADYPAMQTGARALLRIQDGCDEHCTFCATTLARGASRSRSVDSIVDEARLLGQSHPEIVLTGIHIGSYGADIQSSLSLLVEALVTRVPAVRFRLSSLEATEVDDRLSELLRDGSRLAPFLHAPLQSGSDRILKRMGRHWYTAATYESSINHVIAGRPVFGLGADIISGFPGETEQDHRATLALIERLPFTSLHVFPYSERPGAASARLGGKVSSTEVSRRCSELREVSQRKSLKYKALRVDTASDVVAVSATEGLTEDYLEVAIESSRVRRRDRFDARLVMQNSRLTAVPVATLEA